MKIWIEYMLALQSNGQTCDLWLLDVPYCMIILSGRKSVLRICKMSKDHLRAVWLPAELCHATMMASTTHLDSVWFAPTSTTPQFHGRHNSSGSRLVEN